MRALRGFAQPWDAKDHTQPNPEGVALRRRSNNEEGGLIKTAPLWLLVFPSILTPGCGPYRNSLSSSFDRQNG
jgi:hypothetical protein